MEQKLERISFLPLSLSVSSGSGCLEKISIGMSWLEFPDDDVCEKDSLAPPLSVQVSHSLCEQTGPVGAEVRTPLPLYLRTEVDRLAFPFFER
jgi:hypothetical protein